MLFDIGQFLDQFSASRSGAENLFSTRRKAWHENNSAEPRCDFSPGRSAISGSAFKILSLWRRSIYGQSLREIKENSENIPFFIDSISRFIRQIIGDAISAGQWAIVTPPPRRHREHNFASEVARGIARKIGIPAFTDIAEAHTRQRIAVDFTLRYLPDQQNLIVFDDIVTTGSTFQSMHRMLATKGKALLFIAAIKNS